MSTASRAEVLSSTEPGTNLHADSGFCSQDSDSMVVKGGGRGAGHDLSISSQQHH
jgi:hypothetical protein